jgi:methyltransferase (TIGR00027 family)
VEFPQPSRTALAAAAHRAAHQLIEHGKIFCDPLAVRILGPHSEASLGKLAEDPSTRRLRLFIAVRARFCEDTLTGALAEGVRQVVVLGAGLDTFAYRQRGIAGLRVFEVDHPATQAWKKECLAAASIAVPESTRFVSLDFTRGSLTEGLWAAGHDPRQRTFFTWLGVVPYLEESSVRATLRDLAGLPGGCNVVFDYINPPDAACDDSQGSEHGALAARVANVGEPFRCYLDTETLLASLRSLGFARTEDLGPPGIRARYLPQYPDPARVRGAHIIHTATMGLDLP